ncbi:unnamed protein product [Bursaphelenchus xylophilus]|uniref:Battenin n=1 Tax=Bursaphelenchus xylophilus TaxID=6326 RepID=A0A7I8XIH9_BURXY|nr:unnamed protein product [Bursaphelenchus xylophilus]CAG9085669.1 unnamed protein product [Bursaphelenchus xylophilus]
MPQIRLRSTTGWNNLLAFWVLGLCSNFAYVIMLSSAKDILDIDKKSNDTDNEVCIPDISKFKCSSISTGAVLLADIIPSLVIKSLAPIFLYKLAYNVRIILTVILMTASFLVVAFSTSVTIGLFGVTLASLGAGLGEVTFLSLSSNFKNDVVSTWSSGTGGAGVFGALTYAMLTERSMMGLAPQTSLMVMLIVPVMFFLTYWKLLISPPAIYKAVLWKPQSYLIPQDARSRHPSEVSDEQNRPLIDSNSSGEEEGLPSSQPEPQTFWQKIRPLLKFMLPLSTVYFGEYFINQGLVELMVFDCSHGFSMSVSSQYRWNRSLCGARKELRNGGSGRRKKKSLKVTPNNASLG